MFFIKVNPRSNDAGTKIGALSKNLCAYTSSSLLSEVHLARIINAIRKPMSVPVDWNVSDSPSKWVGTSP